MRSAKLRLTASTDAIDWIRTEHEVGGISPVCGVEISVGALAASAHAKRLGIVRSRSLSSSRRRGPIRQSMERATTEHLHRLVRQMLEMHPRPPRRAGETTAPS